MFLCIQVSEDGSKGQWEIRQLASGERQTSSSSSLWKPSPSWGSKHVLGDSNRRRAIVSHGQHGVLGRTRPSNQKLLRSEAIHVLHSGCERVIGSNNDSVHNKKRNANLEPFEEDIQVLEGQRLPELFRGLDNGKCCFQYNYVSLWILRGALAQSDQLLNILDHSNDLRLHRHPHDLFEYVST